MNTNLHISDILIPYYTLAHQAGDVEKARDMRKRMNWELNDVDLIECKFNFLCKNPNEIGFKRILKASVRKGYYELAMKIAKKLGVDLTVRQKEKVIKVAVAKWAFPYEWILTEVESLSVVLRNRILEELLRISILYSWHSEIEKLQHMLGRKLTFTEKGDVDMMEWINAWCRS